MHTPRTSWICSTRARSSTSDHDGLEDVKERILEFLAVGMMKGEVAGSILLLVGPPGVGKTSLGQSIADALGRKFYRFSLGGMRDEAEIKGHRRTYIGAMPGKFIQAIKSAGAANPVIMLDEIDKVGASPITAIRPRRCWKCSTRSRTSSSSITTSTCASTCPRCCSSAPPTSSTPSPAPLLDRMEVIRLSGYLTEEKLAIAQHHLLPRQTAKRAGLTKRSQLRIDRRASRRDHRGLRARGGRAQAGKELGAHRPQGGGEAGRTAERADQWYGANDLERYLGKPVFRKREARSGVGVITGLAWTAMGGVDAHRSRPRACTSSAAASS